MYATMGQTYGGSIVRSSTDGHRLVNRDRLSDDSTSRVIAGRELDPCLERVVVEEGAGLDEAEKGQREDGLGEHGVFLDK